MPDRLTLEQRKEFRKVFDAYDKDGTGHISQAELGEVLAEMNLHTSGQELKDIYENTDIDKSGSIEFHEFLVMMADAIDAGVGEDDEDDEDVNTEKFTEELRAQLKIWDENGDGKISSSELRKFVETVGDGAVSAKVLEDLIVELDTNRNGVIEYNEFIVMLTQDS
ncbi:hypothetical protein BC936DRAFT_137237 [Jimgerdemannia flammicorona]|uniref:EF-hand domain-containing protein n=1 Tax=Jimgerdemannia flammicorona TaxID=994334 RepID=A0A433CXV3_9FUNG|nr:hypothetical protein BC936DRAFT_137237 [Jimgerdemannia flammicorona]